MFINKYMFIIVYLLFNYALLFMPTLYLHLYVQHYLTKNNNVDRHLFD